MSTSSSEIPYEPTYDQLVEQIAQLTAQRDAALGWAHACRVAVRIERTLSALGYAAPGRKAPWRERRAFIESAAANRMAF